MTGEISQELLKKCKENMELFGVPEDFRQFCHDVMHLEYEMSSEPGDIRLKFSTSSSSASGDDGKESMPADLDRFSFILQSTLAKFKGWTLKLKGLSETSKLLPPLNIAEGKVKQMKAPYYLRAGEMSIQEGELMEVLEWTQDGCIKVKVGPGREGVIPILCLIMPSSDFNLNSLIERLHVLILCSWFESFRIFFQRLFKLLLILLDALSYTYPSNVSTHASGPKTSKDLRVLKKLVSRLEADHLREGEDARESRVLVEKLSRAYEKYKVFEKFLKNFKVPDEMDKLHPLCIFDKLSEFQSRVPKDKPIKYYKTKIVIESVETREEIFHYPANDSSSTFSDSSTQQTKVESERLTSSSQEVQKRFVVKAVRDPRTGKDISLDEAMREGVLDMNRGLYIDPSTGDVRPIPAAMNEGLIKVEAVTETVTKPKTEEVGIMTVKSLRSEYREYKILQAIDPITAEKLSPDMARKRGWLTDEGYKVESRMMPMDEAVEIGWVQVEYLASSDPDLPEDQKYEARTYVVHSVADEERSRFVGFAEAVAHGLIDVEQGCYMDLLSRERICLDEALRRGLVKGRRLREGEDPGVLAANPDNRVMAGNLKDSSGSGGGVSFLPRP